MDEKSEYKKIFRCNICEKNYSSASSLCNHNKKFHNIIPEKSLIIPEKSLTIPEKSLINIPNKIICNYCNKVFTRIDNMRVHQKNYCKNKTNDIMEENKSLKEEIIEIKKLLLQNAKIHPKTLQKINKQLINNNTNTTTNTTNINNQNNTINNGPVINNTFVKFGHEHLSLLLTNKQMYRIVNSCCTSIEESIKTVHFNKNLPEYNNIFITNLRDSIAYIFDGIKFISVSKDEVIGELLQNHKNNIEEFMEKAKLPEYKYTRIMKFLEAINDVDEVYVDVNSNNKRFRNYQAYKLNIIKHLIYNNSDSKLLKKLNNLELEEKFIEYPDTET